MPLRSALLLAVSIGACAAGALLAQPVPEAMTAGETGKDRPVDESALRYFARIGDTARLQAETARLKALYPGWTPPADPLDAPALQDAKLKAIWMLLGEGRVAEARANLAQRRADEPGWLPPEDLLRQLARAEARIQLVNASDLNQADAVIALAADNPDLLVCENIDILWRLAAAFAATGKPDRARDVYGYIINSCNDPAARQASLEKALGQLDRPHLETLLSRGKPDAATGAPEFRTIRLELARRALAGTGDPNAPAATPEDLALVNGAFADQAQASDALLLGWAAYRQKSPEAARAWFEKAAKLENSAEAARGLALADIDARDFAAAEAAMLPWRDSSDDARAVYLLAAVNLLAGDPPAALPAEVLQRIVTAVVAARDAKGAEQLGWYARAFGQTAVAGQWFAQALAWAPDNEPAAFGLTLTRQDLQDADGLRALQASWGGRSDRIAAVGAGAAAPTADRGTGTSIGIGPASGGRAGGQDRALAEGWRLLDLNRPVEAASAFERALTSGSERVRQDAAYGQSLAYLRSGLVDQAAVAALKAPQAPARGRELQSTIMADRATAAFRQGRYGDALLALDTRARIAPERVDLLVLRGWSYLKLNRREDARRAFAAAAGTGSAAGREGLEVLQKMPRIPGSAVPGWAQ